MKIEQVILYQIDSTSKIAKQYSQREFDRLGLDLTVEQWILIKIIDENDSITQKELAIKSFRDPSSITRTLDILEKKKIISRVPIPNDRRAYGISLSNKGKKFIKDNMDIIIEHRIRSIDGLTNEEIKTLFDLLKRIQKNMS